MKGVKIYECKRTGLYLILHFLLSERSTGGLIGIFRFDLVAFLFGDMSWLSRIIYTLVGLSGLYLISTYGRICQVDDAR